MQKTDKKALCAKYEIANFREALLELNFDTHNSFKVKLSERYFSFKG